MLFLNIDLSLLVWKMQRKGFKQHSSHLTNSHTKITAQDYSFKSCILFLSSDFLRKMQNIVLASHPCTCVLHRQGSQLHTIKLPKFVNFHGDFHQKWHFAHPKISFAHSELPFLAKSMMQNKGLFTIWIYHRLGCGESIFNYHLDIYFFSLYIQYNFYQGYKIPTKFNKNKSIIHTICYPPLVLRPWALSYNSVPTLSQAFQPMAAQLSKKAALPLAKILATAACHSSETGPRFNIQGLDSI